MARKAVEAPKGFHWMKSGKGFKLMKNPSAGYKSLKGARKKSSFKILMIHKEWHNPPGFMPTFTLNGTALRREFLERK